MPFIERIRERGGYETVTATAHEIVKSTSAGCSQSFSTIELENLNRSITYVPSFEYEKITDLVCDDSGTCGPRNLKRYNPITHVKEKFSTTLPDFRSGIINAYGDCQTYGRLELTNHLSSFLGYSANVAKFEEIRTLNGFQTEPGPGEISAAINKVVPSIDTLAERFNIYTFLLELKDVRRLVLNAGKRIDDIGKKSPDLLDDAAGAWLSWNWGVVPLAGDIKTIVSLMESIDQAIMYWNDCAKRGETLSFHSTVYKDSVVGEDIYDADLTQNALNHQVITRYTEGVSESYVSIYIVPIEIPYADELSIKLQSLGVKNPLSGIWNALPWSWLVDYIIEVGDALEAFENAMQDNFFKFEVISAGYSNKVVTKSHATNYLTYWTLGEVLNSEISHETSEYTRVPIPGDSIRRTVEGVSWDGNLNARRITNIAAVAQKLRR